MSDARACTECGRLQAYPWPVCSGCGGRAFIALAVPCQAEVFSQTVVSRAPTAALQAEVPYAAVLVRGAAGGLLLLRMAGNPPGIGHFVTVCERDGVLVAETA